MSSVTVIDNPRPLRRDAERNRRRILDAAGELFAQRGLGVSLNDIAHHAGVGVGTVYRRFPDKAVLVDEVFEQRVEELVALMTRAVADPDPWAGLTGFLERALALQAKDSALRDLVLGRPDGPRRVARIRQRLLPLGAELVRRAHATGELDAGIAAQDLPVIQLMVNAVIDSAREVEPELWRRYLAILIRGLRAAPGGPPLAPGPLEPSQVDVVMANTLARPPGG